MSALEALEAQEIEVVGLALNAVVNGEFFPDWEFETLFGFSRSDVRAIGASWPSNLLDADTESVVFNALTNLQGYPHGLDAALAGFGLTGAAISAVHDKLRLNESD